MDFLAYNSAFLGLQNVGDELKPVIGAVKDWQAKKNVVSSVKTLGSFA